MSNFPFFPYWKYITTTKPPESHEYLDCFMGLTVSWSSSSACAHMPKLFHGPDCFTVSTCCPYIDLGSRGYFGVNVALVFLFKKGGLSRSGISGLLRFIEFSWISLFICYTTVPCLPEVFRCFTAWNSLWHMRRVRWPHRTISNSLVKLCLSQVTLPRCQNLSPSASLTYRRRPPWRVCRVPHLMTKPATFLICQLSWQTLLHCTGLNQFPRLLWSRMRTIFNAQVACPRPLHRWLRNRPLVTSWDRWLRSLRLFQGPFLHFRA